MNGQWWFERFRDSSFQCDRRLPSDSSHIEHSYSDDAVISIGESLSARKASIRGYSYIYHSPQVIIGPPMRVDGHILELLMKNGIACHTPDICVWVLSLMRYSHVCI